MLDRRVEAGRHRCHVLKPNSDDKTFCGVTPPFIPGTQVQRQMDYAEWRDCEPIHPAVTMCARCEGSAAKAKAAIRLATRPRTHIIRPGRRDESYCGMQGVSTNGHRSVAFERWRHHPTPYDYDSPPCARCENAAIVAAATISESTIVSERI